MFGVARNSSVRTFAALGRSQNRFFFTQLFQQWNKQVIYPPEPSQISTQNRLFPTYVENAAELHNLLLFKHPLLVNFTYPGEKRANRLTQALFDVLSDLKKYPLDSNKFPVGLANVAVDSEGGRDLLLTYSVGKAPSVLLLSKQMPVDRYVPLNLDGDVDVELAAWIKTAIGR